VKRVGAVALAAIVAAVLAMVVQLRRMELAVTDVVAPVTAPAPPPVTDAIRAMPAVARGPKVAAATPRA
jgi:ABC-type transport system involved in cytochrome c biogenesis permease component